MTKRQLSVGFAITSLVTGILGVLLGLTGLGLILGVPAIIFGAIAIKHRSGFGMAVAGVILGALGVLASIIFLVVLTSLPALQQSQRDTARKADVGTVNTAIVSYSSNNQGALPTNDEINDGSFLKSNLGDDVSRFHIVTGTAPTADTIVFESGVGCSEDGSVTGPRHYNLQTKLESGQVYCVGY